MSYRPLFDYWTHNGPWWIRLSNVIGNLLEAAGGRLEDLAHWFHRCPDCRRSRWYGPPCR